MIQLCLMQLPCPLAIDQLMQVIAVAPSKDSGRHGGKLLMLAGAAAQGRSPIEVSLCFSTAMRIVLL